MDSRRAPEATELIYLPNRSAVPAFVAVGLALAAVGAFAGWVYAAVGGIVALVALRVWIKAVAAEVSRLPRSQRTDTAVIPAVPVRGSARND